jgi:hypothetical protein
MLGLLATKIEVADGPFVSVTARYQGDPFKTDRLTAHLNIAETQQLIGELLTAVHEAKRLSS